MPASRVVEPKNCILFSARYDGQIFASSLSSAKILLLFQSASFCITICRCLTFPTARNSVDFMAITLLFSNVRSDKKNHLAITAEMQLIPDF
ncbi:hypothetical protein T4A_11596 [Trichinella pseudospiralis]|uniref:Uncharacterized protein n=1 Tax=Trichinella pseudospiralis TaxID=6337 RepID=A0A0V1DWP9_TRIPS|nr:hypothetical protein T4A_11596 [Trichinella pseudospiralis]